MDRERWQAAERIFERALEEDAATRNAFLTEACGGDSALRSEVEGLLRHHESAEAGGFLEDPARLTEALDAEAAPEDPFVGKELGPYRVQSLQGSGGMGNVYLAVRQAEFRHQVAIKVLRRSMASGDLLRRFSSEMQVLAVLSKHETIAGLLDAGSTEDGLPYFVMEFVDGEPIDAYCDHHRNSLRERIALFRQICDAVQFAHQHMVIHRDLKTGNILVRVDGVPKLIDFGIAKLVSPELAGADAAVTIAARRFMTPNYASPEQVRGESLTTASDVYSLGVVLYELLSGCLPYDLEGLRQDEQLHAICEVDPEPPSRAFGRTADPERVARLRGTTAKKLRAALDGDLDAILLKALRKEPQRRYGSAEALADDLELYLEGRPVEARPVGPVRQVYRWGRRNPVPAALLATVVLSLAGGFWHLERLSEQLVQATAIEGATLEAQTLSLVQDFYAKQVVDKVKTEVPVSHRYDMIEGAIPVPATFTIDLGEHIRQAQDSGMSARLYSAYPFAHREDGGPKDDFEAWALETLTVDPGRPVYRFETHQGRPSLRYATGWVMKQSCVDCHNSHPDSVKTDWRTGELRGVLEIVRPLDLDITRAQQRLRETLAYMLGVSVLLLGLALLFLRRPHKK